MVAVAGLAALAVAIILYVRKGEGSACKKKIAPLNRGLSLNVSVLLLLIEKAP